MISTHYFPQNTVSFCVHMSAISPVAQYFLLQKILTENSHPYFHTFMHIYAFQCSTNKTVVIFIYFPA